MTQPLFIGAAAIGAAVIAAMVLESDPQASAAPAIIDMTTAAVDDTGALPDVLDPIDPLTQDRGQCSGPSLGPLQSLMHLVSTAPAASPRSGNNGDSPLSRGAGDRTFPVTTDSPRAQQYFDQGLQFTYAFNHAAAVRSFRNAQALDPECAMCYWGEALVMGPNINAPMTEAAVAPAYAAVSQAVALSDRTTTRERMLISALARRYAPQPTGNRSALDRAYAEAMATAAHRFPDDPDIAVLYAKALVGLQAWDYWESDFATPKGSTAEIIATLESVLARDPDHPAARHLYVHIVGTSKTPEQAEPYVDRL